MSTEAKVGIFVIVCSILLSATVYYVGNEQWGHHMTSYRTYLRYAGGVAPGSDVLFGGIYSRPGKGGARLESGSRHKLKSYLK